MNLGETIYRLRTEKNMSQGDLADALGVSRQSVSKWENGNAIPDLEKLVKMSKLFGVTLDALVGESEPTPPGLTDPPGRGVTLREIFGLLMLSFSVLVLLTALLVGKPWVETGIYVFLLLGTIGSVCCWPDRWILQGIVFFLDAAFLFIIAIFGDPLSSLIFSIPFWIIVLVWLYREEQEESE